MPPKTVYTRNKIIDAALEVIRKKGVEKLSAQEVARELGGSTMPIYVQFPSMVELHQAVDERCLELLKDAELQVRTGKPFFDMGIGYVAFARSEQRLFRDVLLPMNLDMSENGPFIQSCLPYMEKDPILALLPRERLAPLCMKMWIFAHGLATMSSLNHFMNKDVDQAVQILDEVGRVIIRDELERAKQHLSQ